ncbi:MAG: glycosyltransferase [Rickettsiales bacterium]|jgi:glycosyltransferase involved in cell wall biosynthesis/organic radical activating enzyme|nr:glycosyltransferase [Rickettsiales bacterium]
MSVLDVAHAKDAPVLSFIIPFYNVAKYLDRCIASVACQTLRNIEIILVDDCGEDASRGIAEGWAAKDKRIKIITNSENSGAGISRNVGMDAAMGEFVAFVDSDDYIAPDWSQIMLTAAWNTGAEIAVSRAAAVWSDGYIEDYVRGFFEQKFENKVYTDAYGKFRSHTVWGVLLRRDFINSNGLRFLFLRAAEDSEFMYRASAHAKMVVVEPRATYFYVQRGDSLTGGGGKEKRLFIARCQLFAAERLLEYFGECDLPDKADWVMMAQRHMMSGVYGFMVMAAGCPEDYAERPLYQRYKNILLSIDFRKNKYVWPRERKILRMLRLSDTLTEFALLSFIEIGQWFQSGIIARDEADLARGAGRAMPKAYCAFRILKSMWRAVRPRLPRLRRSRFARIDFCTLCCLDCPTCQMRLNNYCERGAGYLTLENFKLFAAKNKHIRQIEITGAGEPFLNPDFVKIIEYADARGIKLSCHAGTNFNAVSDAALEAMVKFGMLYLNVAVDGACQETYSKYRRGGDFDKVIRNIEKLNEFKKKYNSGLPTLSWQYVILPSNDSIAEIKRAKAMAAELDMMIMFLRDWAGYVPKDRLSEIKFETDLRFADVYEHSGGAPNGRRYLPCYQLWKAPQVNWDGRIFGCCVNWYKGFEGNAFTDGLEKCKKMGLYKASQKMLRGGKVCDDSPCFTCRFRMLETIFEKRAFMTRAETYPPEPWFC